MTIPETIPELVYEIEARGGRLLLDGGRVKYRGPEGLLTPDVRAALSRHRDRLAATLADAPPPADPRPAGRLRVSEFAASGRLLRIRSALLGGAEVYLAADNADTSPVPSDAVIFYPDEFAQLRTAGPDFLKLLWETKRLFAPHARTHPEPAPD